MEQTLHTPTTKYSHLETNLQQNSFKRVLPQNLRPHCGLIGHQKLKVDNPYLVSFPIISTLSSGVVRCVSKDKYPRTCVQIK